MQFYGNAIWNGAVSNEEKRIIPMSEDAFLKIQKLLDDSELNYYAYAKDGMVKMAVPQMDIENIKRLVGDELASQMQIQTSTVAYTPPKMNIIGENYRNIQNKSYLSGSTDRMLKVAEELQKAGIRFSGRVYGSDRTTLTINAEDLSRAQALESMVHNRRKGMYPKREDALEVIGNLENSPVKRAYFSLDTTPDIMHKLAPALEEVGLQFTANIYAKDTIISVPQEMAYKFEPLFDRAKNLIEQRTILSEEGFTADQIATLNQSTMQLAEAGSDVFELLQFIKKEYTTEQLETIDQWFQAYYAQPLLERLADKAGHIDTINALQAKYDLIISLNRLCEGDGHDYSEEQREVLLSGLEQGISPEIFTNGLDESFTPNEMREFINLVQDYNALEIDKFYARHSTLIYERNQEISKSIPETPETFAPFIEPTESTSEPIEEKMDSDLQSSSVDEKIHAAFEAARNVRLLTAKQEQYLDRLEKFAKANQITENPVDAAFEQSPLFRQTYGDKKTLSRSFFNGRFGDIKKALDSELDTQFGRIRQEEIPKEAPESEHFPTLPTSSPMEKKLEPVNQEEPPATEEVHLPASEPEQDFSAEIEELRRTILSEYSGIPHYIKTNLSEPHLKEYTAEKIDEIALDLFLQNDGFVSYFLGEKHDELINSLFDKCMDVFGKKPEIPEELPEHMEDDSSNVSVDEEKNSIPIEDLNLSIRAFNALKRAGINTDTDYEKMVSEIGEEQAANRIGPRSVTEFQEHLTEHKQKQSNAPHTTHDPIQEEQLSLDSILSEEPEQSEQSAKLTEDDFISYATGVIQDSIEVRNSHANSDHQNFVLDVHATIDQITTELMTADREIDGCTLSDIAGFINRLNADEEMYSRIYDTITGRIDNILTTLEETQKAAQDQGIPFSDRFSSGLDEETDPLIYDGSMSVEDARSVQEQKSEENITITCELSESPVFEEGKTYTVAEFDKIMKEADSERHDSWKNGIEEYGSAEAFEKNDEERYYQFLGYDKTKFTVNFPDGSTITERQDIGDGDGGVIDFLRSIPSYQQYIPMLEEQRDKDIQRTATAISEPTNEEIATSSPLGQKSKDELPQAASSESHNYTITDDQHGTGGAKTKFKANLAAIETLKLIESENRSATPEEQSILAQYVGWGGLANAFDPTKSEWSKEYTALKDVLTESEYDAARASTLDAFYTSPVIIDSIYQALEQFGFKGGEVLEPACGVGNFFGRMPEEMRQHSNLHGVEIDSISGRIAALLYPDADIAVKGFEKTAFANGQFDVAVGNVPFGEQGVPDKAYDSSLKLHDYFFAKSLDKVKEGGIVAFVTSKGTLDKQDESFRKYLAEHSDLIGAVRLPNDAFKANAGTEVTSDIIFLQKRSAPPEELPDWVHLGATADGLSINQYFADHLEMVLGTIVEGNKLYGNKDTMCIPIEGADLGSQLKEAVSQLHAQISNVKTASIAAEKDAATVTAPEDLRNYSFFLDQSGKVCFKTSDTQSHVWEKDGSKTAHSRAADYIELRDMTRSVLAAQEQGCSDAQLTALQQQLNTLYDNFYKKHGLLHSRGNKIALSQDVSYPLVCSLEQKFDKTKLIAKSDLFTKRTIKIPEPVTHVDTAHEALIMSMTEKGRIDFSYMESLSDIPKDVLIQELRGDIYPAPELSSGDHIVYQEASAYLSGDIRKKIDHAKAAAEQNPIFAANITALEQVLPEPLKAGDIDVKIGAEWIDPKIYQQFMYETFGTPKGFRADQQQFFWKKPKLIQLEFAESTETWNITNKGADTSISATKTFGTRSVNAYEIMEDLLNLREPKVYMTVRDNGEEKRVLDMESTKIAGQKAEKIRNAFKSWIFKDPERRAELVDTYNRRFNSIRPREYDGSHMTFPGMNAEIRLHGHQKNAIAHAIFGGNTLFAHTVGAGKTFEMIATAMESKRLGLCSKSLFAVPNHLTEQIGEDFMKLYPNANILVATKKDFTKENRQKLISRIATGNFDAVIIGHTQLSMIPLSAERQAAELREQIADIVDSISLLKASEGSKFQVKQMERTKKSLQRQLDKLEKEHQDDVITFEQLGVDRLFVDEAHEFKNLFCPTKLQNVAGISNSASQKAQDLFMKVRYLDEKTGSRGTIFATGTPLSNSVTELHTMMRYLQYDFLQSKGLHHFDSWVSVFGEQKTDYELAPAGNKYRQRTRIANYCNMPELMSMFKMCSDIKTADMLHLNVPDCELHIVNAEPSELQQKLVTELSARADDVQAGEVQPDMDNMLRITGDGRKVGLDPRLVDPTLPDCPTSKLNQCVENVLRIHAETAEDKLTQIIFCDLGVPHPKKSEAKEEADVEEEESADVILEEICDFCVYDDIKEKLVAKGIPESEIAFIHDAPTEKAKSELFEKVRSGEVRVLIGSTGKMGTGTNVQDRLIALHDLDIPWRPADLEQRRGRMVRQGNRNKNVHLYRYVTKGTFDAYSYQTLEKKQKFIAQIMTSKTPARTCEDVDQQALSYSEIKALCTGDERIRDLMALESDVKNLTLLQAEHRNTVYEMEDKLQRYPDQRASCERLIEQIQADIQIVQQRPIDRATGEPIFRITLDGQDYTDKTEAGKALEKACFACLADTEKPIVIGNIHGFPIQVQYNKHMGIPVATLNGSSKYSMEFTASFPHNLRKLETTLLTLPNRLHEQQERLERLDIDAQDARKLLAEPFPAEAELAEKSERLTALRDEVNEAAAAAAKANPDAKRTYYFEAARMKKMARNIATPKPKAEDRSQQKPNIE